MADMPEAPEADAPDTPEPTEPEAPETPDTPEAEDTPSEPEIPEGYVPQDRYDNLRSETDRTKQFLSALEGKQGPEAQQRAYEQLGLQVVDDEEDEDDEYLDPDERINRLEEQLKERDERAQQEDIERREGIWIQQQLDEVEKAEGYDLTDEAAELIVDYAVNHRFDDGRPDIEGGVKQLKAAIKAQQKRIADSKKNAPKPPSGVPGDEKLDTLTPEGRRAAIEQIAEQSIAADSE